MWNRADSHCVSACDYVNATNPTASICEKKDSEHCPAYKKVNGTFFCLKNCNLLKFIGNECFDTCPAATPFSLARACVASCPVKTFDKTCVDVCPADALTMADSGQCVSICPTGYTQQNGKCVLNADVKNPNTVGIVIGSIVGVLVVIAVGIYIIYKKNKKQKNKQ